jgi:hypothetical protein
MLKINMDEKPKLVKDEITKYDNYRIERAEAKRARRIERNKKAAERG